MKQSSVSFFDLLFGASGNSIGNANSSDGDSKASSDADTKGDLPEEGVQQAVPNVPVGAKSSVSQVAAQGTSLLSPVVSRMNPDAVTQSQSGPILTAQKLEIRATTPKSAHTQPNAASPQPTFTISLPSHDATPQPVVPYLQVTEPAKPAVSQKQAASVSDQATVLQGKAAQQLVVTEQTSVSSIEAPVQHADSASAQLTGQQAVASNQSVQPQQVAEAQSTNVPTVRSTSNSDQSATQIINLPHSSKASPQSAAPQPVNSSANQQTSNSNQIATQQSSDATQQSPDLQGADTSLQSLVFAAQQTTTQQVNVQQLTLFQPQQLPSTSGQTAGPQSSSSQQDSQPTDASQGTSAVSSQHTTSQQVPAQTHLLSASELTVSTFMRWGAVRSNGATTSGSTSAHSQVDASATSNGQPDSSAIIQNGATTAAATVTATTSNTAISNTYAAVQGMNEPAQLGSKVTQDKNPSMSISVDSSSPVTAAKGKGSTTASGDSDNNEADGQPVQHAQSDPSQAAVVADKSIATIESQPSVIQSHVSSHEAAASRVDSDSNGNVSKSGDVSSTPRPESLGGAGAQVSSGINTARVIQSVGETEMRVGMHSTEFGDISIRTSVSQQQMMTQISVDHGALGAAISARIPSVQEKLGNDHGVQATIQLNQSGTSTSDGRGQSSQREQKTYVHSAPVADVVAGAEADRSVLRAPPAVSGEYRLDVTA